MTSSERGAVGEQLAEKHYKKQKYTIAERNFSTRFGEIDIIAQKGKQLVFSEVKTRNEISIAAPREWVGASKQKKIINAAKLYLRKIGSDDFFIRFDVVEVIFKKDGSTTLHCIEDAFTL